MADSLQLYGFGYTDRSSKVRWTAAELDIPVEEHKVELGDNRKEAYRSLNPFASIPTTVYRGETLIESTATCIHLAEMFPEKLLAVFAKETGRYEYLKWISIFAETLEGRLVDYVLTKFGLMPETVRDIYHKPLAFKCRVLQEQLPAQGFLVADRFTVVDIIAAYSLKIAIPLGFIQWQQVEGYLGPLMERPAATKARFFDSLKDFLEKQA